MRKPRRTRFAAYTGRIGEIGNPGGNRPAADSPNSPPSSSELAAERQDADPLQPASGSDEATDTPPADSLEPPPSWLRFLTSRRPQRANQRPAGLLVGCLALGLLGGYLLGRHAARAPGVGAGFKTPEGTVRLTTNELDNLDAAYTARYTHHFAEAERLFTALGRTHPDWPMIKAELGRTMLFAGKPADARRVLNSAIIGGAATADAHFALGETNLVEKNFRDAETSLAAAIAADPTRADFYFLWGECLRDQGKPLEAADRFRSALFRNVYETADGLYRLKLWLCEIDANVENKDGLGTVIDTALAQGSPPMEILFAAAARDLRAGDFRAATAYVRRARALVDPAVYGVILNDPTFIQVRAKPECAEMFRADPTASAPPSGSPAPSPAASTTGK